MNNKLEFSGWVVVDKSSELFYSRGYDIAICDKYNSYPSESTYLGNRICDELGIEEDKDEYDWGYKYGTIDNCFIQFYISEEEITIEEAQEYYLRKLLGDVKISGEEYGYSEYTIMGFTFKDLVIGNHDLNEILVQYEGKYINFVMEWCKDE